MGRKAKAKAGGFAGGKAPYGYARDKAVGLVVVPEEAEVVRQIFAWRRQGLGTKAIAARLNRRVCRPGAAGRGTSRPSKASSRTRSTKASSSTTSRTKASTCASRGSTRLSCPQKHGAASGRKTEETVNCGEYPAIYRPRCRFTA